MVLLGHVGLVGPDPADSS
ncbi:hypothetical protein HaLaN_00781 [Haematococcus lacustris]|uniref:Uncharacterized protein n=1 Tax=Haematococcus lacustris TaxID=44745 RepID=A0A699YA25_HAELA|nr:hypothetical protein HaLaN_00781 [Haematococcus lacustris]